MAFGEVEGNVIGVIYTWREERRRIISARLANGKERDAYHQAIGRGDIEEEGQG